MYERRLIFQAWQNTGWTVTLCVVGVAALTCVWILYRYERRLITRRLGLTLLSLRLLVVLTVILALFEPVLSWERARSRLGRVLVAVDVSQSMDTRDIHASPGEKLRWSRGLGMIGNEQTRARLDHWQAAFDRGDEPEWVAAAEVGDPREAAELARQRQAQLEQVFAEVDRLSRREIILRLLNGPRSAWLEQLRELGEVEFLVFAGSAAAVTPEGLEAQIQDPATTVVPGATHIGSVLSRRADGEGGRELLGVAILTDGRATIHPGEFSLEDQARSLGSAIYPVLIGSELPIRDVAVAHIEAPAVVFQDDAPTVRATLRTAGFEGRPLRITLHRHELAQTLAGASNLHLPAEPLQEQVVTPGGPVTEVLFPLGPQSEPGRYRYVVRSDLQSDELRDDNNELGVTLSVIDGRSRVLILEGEARWEFRFLEIALKRDTRVDVDAVVFEQPYLGVLSETFFQRRLALPSQPVSHQPTPFAEYDLVIVGDVAARDLRRPAWELLDRYVRREGGTLLLLAGKRHLPSDYFHEVFQGLMPVENLVPFAAGTSGDPAPPDQRGVRLRLTPEAEALAVFQFDADPAENLRIWDELPGADWGLRGTLKGGASAWAVALEPGVEQTLDTERVSVVIAEHLVGAGRVVWCGFDSTWRWRHRVGDRYHHRFWGQLVRWAAQFKVSDGNEFVRFGAVQPIVEFGNPARLVARFEPGLWARSPELTARVELRPRGDPQAAPVAVLDLVPDSEAVNTHVMETSSLLAGEYEATLLVTSAVVEVPPVTSELTVLEPPMSEKSDVSANPDLLASLAESSSGKLLRLDELDRLPDLLRLDTGEDSRRQEARLWDSWWLLMLFCGLVTAEWVLRKLNGLP